MSDPFSRTRLLLKDAAMQKLNESRVLLFGIGGVGGACAEALVRSGIGSLDLVDSDTVDESNLNRQIFATRDAIGMRKLDAAKKRLLAVNPDLKLTLHDCFFLPENAECFDFSLYDYVIDAVDTVTAKIEIVLRAKEAGVPVISSMGTGNKLDPSRLKLSDLYKTSVCPLARVMRRELKKRGVTKLTVVWSDEEPLAPQDPSAAADTANGEPDDTSADPGFPEDPPVAPRRRQIPGSTAFVPPAAGLLIASKVVRDLTAHLRAEYGPTE